MSTDEPKSMRGFTLVELIVAMVLVAIFAALAVPSVTNTMQRAEARRTARELANAFRRARNQAMSRGEVVVAEVVTKDGSNSGYVDAETGTTSETAESNYGHVALLRTGNRSTKCSTIGKGPSGNEFLEVGDPAIVDEISNSMRIYGMTGDKEARKICFTPDGRALSESGAVINADSDQCDLENFRLWIARRDIDTGSTSALRAARKCGGDTIERTKINFWVVEVPYNGSIKAKN